MLPAYGCRHAQLRFGVDALPEGLQHMVNLLRRQEAPEELVIAGKELLPALLPLIVDGVRQRLKKLQLGEWRDVWSDFIAGVVEVPVALFQGLPTLLSALEELRLYQRWPEALDQEAWGWSSRKGRCRGCGRSPSILGWTPTRRTQFRNDKLKNRQCLGLKDPNHKNKDKKNSTART